MGGAENKRKKEGRRRVWAYGFWVWAGLTHGSWVGQKRYKRVETHFFLISFFSFSLFSFLRAKRSLLSPPSPLSFPARQRAVEGSPTQWPASYRGGATASELKPPPFFSKFFFSYVFYPPDSVSELKIPEKLAYDPRSRD